MKTILRLLTVSLTLILGILGIAYWYITHPLPLSQPQEYLLENGRSVRAIARELERAGVLEESYVLPVLARILERDNRIKAGSYALSPPLSLLDLLDKLTQGDVNQSQIALIEGWNFRQVRQAVARNPALKRDARALSDAALLQALGIQATHPEGLFFPDTYFFAAGSSDLTVLQRAHKLHQQVLAEVWAQRDFQTPYRSPYEALIMASIVEKETAKASERAQIAAVFLNRMRIGMRLQTDPTVIYGLGENFSGNLRKIDLMTDTPYNTYTRHGLPPTPIAIVGKAALQAALHPQASHALYFVAKGDGSHQFSATLDAHNRAVNRYQRGQP